MLEIYSPSGQLLVGPSTSVGTLLGTFTVSGSAGSITNAALAKGTPFIFSAIPTSGSAPLNMPIFTFSGTTLSWSYPTGGHTNATCRVTYGVI